MLFLNGPVVYLAQAGERAVSIQTTATVIVRVVSKSQEDAGASNIKKETIKKNGIIVALQKIKEKFMFMNIVK